MPIELFPWCLDPRAVNMASEISMSLPQCSVYKNRTGYAPQNQAAPRRAKVNRPVDRSRLRASLTRPLKDLSETNRFSLTLDDTFPHGK